MYNFVPVKIFKILKLLNLDIEEVDDKDYYYIFLNTLNNYQKNYILVERGDKDLEVVSLEEVASSDKIFNLEGERYNIKEVRKGFISFNKFKTLNNIFIRLANHETFYLNLFFKNKVLVYKDNNIKYYYPEKLSKGDIFYVDFNRLWKRNEVIFRDKVFRYRGSEGIFYLLGLFAYYYIYYRIYKKALKLESDLLYDRGIILKLINFFKDNLLKIKLKDIKEVNKLRGYIENNLREYEYLIYIGEDLEYILSLDSMELKKMYKKLIMKYEDLLKVDISKFLNEYYSPSIFREFFLGLSSYLGSSSRYKEKVRVYLLSCRSMDEFLGVMLLNNIVFGVNRLTKWDVSCLPQELIDKIKIKYSSFYRVFIYDKEVKDSMEIFYYKIKSRSHVYKPSKVFKYYNYKIKDLLFPGYNIVMIRSDSSDIVLSNGVSIYGVKGEVLKRYIKLVRSIINKRGNILKSK